MVRVFADDFDAVKGPDDARLFLKEETPPYSDSIVVTAICVDDVRLKAIANFSKSDDGFDHPWQFCEFARKIAGIGINVLPLSHSKYIRGFRSCYSKGIVLLKITFYNGADVSQMPARKLRMKISKKYFWM